VAYIVYFKSLLLLFFFFQAKDGIRDRNVTGVQTCALPISYFVGYTPNIVTGVWVGSDDNTVMSRAIQGGTVPAIIWKDVMKVARSEERRVGKECRCRVWRAP